MATAVVKHPKRETRVVEICPGKVTLELSWREAEILKTILGRVGGGVIKGGARGNTEDRKLSDGIYRLLDNEGVVHIEGLIKSENGLTMRDEPEVAASC